MKTRDELQAGLEVIIAVIVVCLIVIGLRRAGWLP